MVIRVLGLYIRSNADRSMWNFGMARVVFTGCISCDMLIIRLRDQGVHALLLRLLLVLSSTQHALIQVHRSPVHNRSILPWKAELRVYGSLLAHESSVIHALHKTRIPSAYSPVRANCYLTVIGKPHFSVTSSTFTPKSLDYRSYIQHPDLSPTEHSHASCPPTIVALPVTRNRRP